MKKAIHAAIRLYRDFREKEPRKIMNVPFAVPAAVMVIGYVDEICYTTTHGKKTVAYRHEFQSGSRPLMCASSDGRQLMLFGGRFKFTGRGIVDRNADGALNYDPQHGKDDGFLRRRQANPQEKDRFAYKGYVVKRGTDGRWYISKDNFHIGSGDTPADARAAIDELTG